MFDRLLPVAHNLMRIGVGFAYWTHGAQKTFGWFGGFGPNGTADLLTRFGVAGLIEVTLGVFITLGLFTRRAAFVASGEMAVAYFWMHVAGRGSLWHWANGGERPLLYFLVFLFIAAAGGGSFSLDTYLRKKKSE